MLRYVIAVFFLLFPITSACAEDWPEVVAALIVCETEEDAKSILLAIKEKDEQAGRVVLEKLSNEPGTNYSTKCQARGIPIPVRVIREVNKYPALLFGGKWRAGFILEVSPVQNPHQKFYMIEFKAYRTHEAARKPGPFSFTK